MQTAQNAFGYQNQSCSGRRNQNACISNKRLQKQGLKFRNQIMMGFALGTRNCKKMFLARLCFGYMIEFLMLIREMAFVFNKSKNVINGDLKKKLSKRINCTEVRFGTNE